MAGHPGGRQDRPLRLRGVMAQFWADPTGLTLPIVNEELFWGDAGIGMAIMGTALAVAGDLRPAARPSRWASGSRSASAPPTSSRSAPSASSEPDAGSDVSALRTRAVYDEAKDEWVLNGTEGVDHQRRHRRRPRRRRRRRPRARARAARPRFVVPPGTPGPASRARSSRSTASAPRTPPTSSSTTAASRARCLLGGKEKLDERLARAREGKQPASAGRRCRPSRPPARRSAPRRSASPAPPTSTRSTTPRSASSSASRSSRTRRSPSRSPT